MSKDTDYKRLWRRAMELNKGLFNRNLFLEAEVKRLKEKYEPIPKSKS